MKIVTNEPLIRRNVRVAQISSIAGMVVLIGGMIISLQRTDLFNLSFAALALGFVLSQVGIYFTNRWGRRPRPDESLNKELKGLDAKYTLYHYKTPTPHLLVGPSGVWVLMPRHQRGVITYKNGRWKQTGGGVLLGYLKMFAQEGLGRPDLEILAEVDHIEKFLARTMPDEEPIPVQAVLIFTNEKAEVKIDAEDQPSTPTIPLGKLKDLVRKSAKGKALSLDKVVQIQALLPEAPST
ncbi:MAG: hypothetical protein L0Z70_09185 [Chloroflexi bacterium]|nr:hypothetical protein [Chloroflexota bacterium]